MHFRNLARGAKDRPRGPLREEPLAEEARTDKVELYRLLLGRGAFDFSAEEAYERVCENPNEAEFVGRLLSEGETIVRITASWLLGEAASAGCRIDSSFPYLASGLEDEDPEVRRNTIMALGHAQFHGARMGELMKPLIARLLDEDDEAVAFASIVIWNGAMRGDRDAVNAAVGLMLRSERERYEGGGDCSESWLWERAVNIFHRAVAFQGGPADEEPLQ